MPVVKTGRTSGHTADGLQAKPHGFRVRINNDDPIKGATNWTSQVQATPTAAPVAPTPTPPGPGNPQYTGELTLSVSQGKVGDSVSFIGRAFNPTWSGWLRLGPTLRVATVKADANGAFSGSFVVPNFADGKYTILASVGYILDEKEFTIGAPVVVEPPVDPPVDPPVEPEEPVDPLPVDPVEPVDPVDPVDPVGPAPAPVKSFNIGDRIVVVDGWVNEGKTGTVIEHAEYVKLDDQDGTLIKYTHDAIELAKPVEEGPGTEIST